MKASCIPRRDGLIQNLMLSIFVILFFSNNSYALDDANLLSSRIHKILSEKIPYAEIRIPNLKKLVQSPEISDLTELSSVRLLEDRANGIALVELISTDGKSVKIQTPYQALVKTPVAAHRIYPNVRLKKEDFRIETLNVASGPAREYRGVIIYDENRLNQVESKQSILEGQFVVSNAVQKLPDVRKGETVKLELSSGNLTLSTLAIVQENASVGEVVRVFTTKSKREVTGKVREDRTVGAIL